MGVNTTVFQISAKTVQERVLKLTGYDVDRNRRHRVIGHALYPLKEHICDGGEKVVMWRDLEKVVAEVCSYFAPNCSIATSLILTLQ